MESNGAEVQLGCSHSLCSDCIDEIIERCILQGRDQFECPICRKECHIESCKAVERTEKKIASLTQSSTKIDQIIRDVNEIVGHDGNKIIVFSQFTTVLDILGLKLGKFVRIDGSMDRKTRQEKLHRFKSGCDILLTTLRVSGVGLNLVEANYVMIVEPWWNEAVENQAIDRVYRIGQTRDVTVYRYIIKDSVEEKMEAIQKRKQALMGTIAGGASLDELLAFFE
jgi:SNF2 family DNA or RNA helicase